LESSWGAKGRLLKAVESRLRTLGQLLGGSWEAFGRLLEASKRHLRPKAGIAIIFKRFLKKIEILRSHVGHVLISKIVLFGVPRGYPRRTRFGRRFGIDFGTIFEGQ